MELDLVRRKLVKAKPYYKTLAPGIWSLSKARTFRLISIGVRITKKSIELASGKPLYHVTGDLASEFVIKQGLHDVRNVIVKLHTDVYYGPPKYRTVVLDPGGNPYYYYDEQGKELFRVSRRPGGGFIQEHRDAQGNWKRGRNGTADTLYNLPELLTYKDEPVYIVEGEKDANRLTRAGKLAITNPAGAGKWKDDYSMYLEGREVIILPDNDVVGQRHASQVARSVLPYARSVRVVQLPGLENKQDIYDWLESGNTIKDLEDIWQSQDVLRKQSWDLVFYSNRSTPQVVGLGELPKPKEGYGEITLRRPTQDWENNQLRKGKWLRVDEKGNRPKSAEYKKSTYRPHT